MAEHNSGDGRIRRDIGTPDALLAADPMTIINPQGTRSYGSLDGIYAKTAAVFALNSYGSTMADELWPWAPEYAPPSAPGNLGEAIQQLEWAKRMCDAEIEHLLRTTPPSPPPPPEDLAYLAIDRSGQPLDERARAIRAALHAHEREMLARRHLAERQALDTDGSAASSVPVNPAAGASGGVDKAKLAIVEAARHGHDIPISPSDMVTDLSPEIDALIFAVRSELLGVTDPANSTSADVQAAKRAIIRTAQRGLPFYGDPADTVADLSPEIEALIAAARAEVATGA